MLNIESEVQNNTSSYSTKKWQRNKCVFRCYLNVTMLPELRMASGSPFQTVGAAEEKHVPLFRYVTLVLSASPSQQISVYGMAHMAPLCRADSSVDWTGMPCSTRWWPERNAASDGKPMQMTKEIDGVLLTCGYVVDDSCQFVLDSATCWVTSQWHHITVRCNSPNKLPTIQSTTVLATSRDMKRQMWHSPHMWKFHASWRGRHNPRMWAASNVMPIVFSLSDTMMGQLSQLVVAAFFTTSVPYWSNKSPIYLGSEKWFSQDQCWRLAVQDSRRWRSFPGSLTRAMSSCISLAYSWCHNYW